ncbi:hypothetical protein QAD02_005936 [Eretmocerus hayati]|uniref:Uncharacterized protein n=1 Tax=Eretmocerus hayati TaxID=131215 RepID=A0ACC2MZX5_9HYME|nr:hypothetical protein QAD02_005936 [Eretmocerus hayati]
MDSREERHSDELDKQDGAVESSTEDKKFHFQPVQYSQDYHGLVLNSRFIREHEQKSRERLAGFPISEEKKAMIARHESYYPGYIDEAGKVKPGLRAGCRLQPHCLEHDDPTFSSLSDCESTASYGFGSPLRPTTASEVDQSPSSSLRSPPVSSAEWTGVPQSTPKLADALIVSQSPILSRPRKERLEAFARAKTLQSQVESEEADHPDVEPPASDDLQGSPLHRPSSLTVERGSKLSTGVPCSRPVATPPTDDAASRMYLLFPRGLTDPGILAQIQDFQAKFGASLSNQHGLFDHRTTHVVLETKDWLFEWCQGVVFDKLVVGCSWIVESLEAGEVLNPEWYELCSTLGFTIPKKSQRKSRIFDGWAFLCVPEPSRLTFQRDQMTELLEAAGGEVVSKPSDHVRSRYRVCIIGNHESYPAEMMTKLVKKMTKYDWLIKTVGWLYQSILHDSPQDL